MDTLVWGCFCVTAVSFVLFLWNLVLFRRAPRNTAATVGPVSVLIPARNEEASIERAVESVLNNQGVVLEVVVLDDGSEDATAAVVRRVAARDGRVRLAGAPPLPPGWCGKQHACSVLSGLARYDVFCFMDADVRLAPDALRRMAGMLGKSELVSGFPRQETVTFLERLLLPQIHFVLLAYLPLVFMRLTRAPGFAAGCGQLMMATREGYRRSGGHAAIRSTMHDGILLPRAFRSAGLKTDIFDATDIAVCRMYRNAGEVWRGLTKNAVEGMAAPARLPVFSALLFCGHVLPFALALVTAGAELALASVAMAWAMRLLAARRFQQPLDSALLHPVGVLVLLSVQWYALARHLLKRPSSWKGRAYAAGASGV